MFVFIVLFIYIYIYTTTNKSYCYHQLGFFSVFKKNQFRKTSRTRNNIFLLMLWDFVVKLKYFPPNIHHFCLSIVSHVMLSNKFNFWFVGNKN